MNENLFMILKIIVLASVFFVWGIRYKNIQDEFKSFGYPDWLRDLVGIMKIAFVIMLINDKGEIVSIGAGGIVFLMLCALITHIKVKNPMMKMLPSLALLSACLTIFIYAV